MAVGPESNGSVNPSQPVQERVREFAAVFSANGNNRVGCFWTPVGRPRNRERGGRRRNRRKPLVVIGYENAQSLYDEILITIWRNVKKAAPTMHKLAQR